MKRLSTENKVTNIVHDVRYNTINVRIPKNSIFGFSVEEEKIKNSSESGGKVCVLKNGSSQYSFSF
jgi:hypothetical protein